MKAITTDIIINTASEKVWNILMDQSSYADWNPFIRRISGEAIKGNIISISIQPEGGKPMHFKPVVLKNEKNREFRWLGHLFVKGLFDGEHFFLLETMGHEKTRFIHGERFSGALVSVLMKMMGESTRRGFEAMNQALKLRAESAG